MTKKRRLDIGVALMVIVVGGLLAATLGVPLYMRATAAPLHPQPQSAPSVIQTAPAPQWSHAVHRAREAVRAGLAEGNLPGLSVAVGADGDIVWAEGFGWADIDARVRVTPETRFRVGTASPVLTSAAVGLLLEQGRLHLDEEIQTYVRQFPRTGAPLTLRHLMAHAAGLSTASGDAGFESPLFRQRCESPVQALPAFADEEPRFEPGTRFGWSNYDWILVSAAIEAAADTPFLTFMQEQVFGPLGMAGTGAESAAEENPEHVGEPAEDFPLFTLARVTIFEPLGLAHRRRQSVIPDLATFYYPRTETNPRHGLREMRAYNRSCYAGAMAFFSTPSDLVRFGLAINSGTLLQAATVRWLQDPHQLISGQETGYGLGWDHEIVTLAGARARAVGHHGDELGGRVMTFLTFPDRGIVVAVMSNVAHADTPALALKVAEAFSTPLGGSASN